MSNKFEKRSGFEHVNIKTSQTPVKSKQAYYVSVYYSFSQESPLYMFESEEAAVKKNRKSSINNSSVQNYPYPLNREIHKPVMKTLNIKIRGEESVIRDIMKYIYDKKDIEILQ